MHTGHIIGNMVEVTDKDKILINSNTNTQLITYKERQ